MRRSYKLIQRGHGENRKINFRVFDFSSGDLLWERLFDSQKQSVGMDGRVWEMASDTVHWQGPYQVGISSSTTLPARIAAPNALYNRPLYYANSYDGATGELATTSPYFSFLNVDLTGYASGLPATRYTVNSSGHIMRGSFGFAGTINLYIVDNLTTGPVEYWFNNSHTDSGTLTLTTSPVSSSAVFAITASASTIQSAIETAFASLVNSVTVTAVAGTNIYDGMMKVVIDWAASTSYMATMTISSRVQSVSGSVYSLETGALISRGGTGRISSSYSLSGIWITETKTIRESVDSSNATVPIVECWDTSVSPWVFKWLDNYSKAPWVSGESRSAIGISAKNGQAAMSVARMGSTPFSVRTYDESGYITNFYLGYSPRRLALSDNSNELSAMYLQWNWSQRCEANGLGCTSKDYVTHDGASYVINPLTSLDPEFYNTAANNSATVPSGFNATAIAAISFGPLTYTNTTALSLADSSSGSIDVVQASEPSGLSDPFAPANCYETHWYLSSPIEWLASTCEWRLTFDVSSSTQWFDETSTLADLNAALLTMYGSDIDDRQNVTARVWNSPLPAYKANMVPMFWQQYLEIFARCARNATEAAASGMDLYLSANIPAQVKRLRIEHRGYTSKRTASIAALSRYDGSEIWARGFSAARPDSPCQGMLHDGKLYCTVAYINGQTYRSEL